jgi:hypothetical protein
MHAMNGSAPLSARELRNRAFFIAAVLFISYAYFYQGGGWNQNSRFDMTRAIVEQHTLRIDPYHENTQDKAHFQGHYYSDKAPGLSFLAVPAVALAETLATAAGAPPDSPRAVVAMSYAATLFAVSLPTALAGACLFLLALRLGGSVSGAAFAALSLGLATPIWPYATIFWGHALVGACLLFAFSAAALLPENRTPARDVALALIAGLSAGWATVSEYPAAPAAAILAALALALVWPHGRSRLLRVAAGLTLGAAASLAILLTFQNAAFGSPFHLGYKYDEAFPGMTQGFGLGLPKIDRILKLLFGGRRGIFFHAPVLAVTPFGLWLMWKKPGQRPIAAAAAAIALYYLLFNASFYAWHGGWSYGPRYLSPCLPMLCLGLATLWSEATPTLRRSLAVLALIGGFFSLAAVTTTAQPLEGISYPLFQLSLPNFLAGKLSLNHGSFLAQEIAGENHGAFNLGELAGLHGLLSLLPLFAIWALALRAWFRMERVN